MQHRFPLNFVVGKLITIWLSIVCEGKCSGKNCNISYQANVSEISTANRSSFEVQNTMSGYSRSFSMNQSVTACAKYVLYSCEISSPYASIASSFLLSGSILGWLIIWFIYPYWGAIKQHCIDPLLSSCSTSCLGSANNSTSEIHQVSMKTSVQSDVVLADIAATKWADSSSYPAWENDQTLDGTGSLTRQPAHFGGYRFGDGQGDEYTESEPGEEGQRFEAASTFDVGASLFLFITVAVHKVLGILVLLSSPTRYTALVFCVDAVVFIFSCVCVKYVPGSSLYNHGFVIASRLCGSGLKLKTVSTQKWESDRSEAY